LHYLSIIFVTMKQTPACLAFMVIISTISYSQSSLSVTPQRWNASWISVPGIDPEGYGVYLFRKTLSLGSKPSAYIIHISADNRYRLFVNGKILSQGPARGDFYFWNYESVDIGPELHSGKNTIAAIVWNEGKIRPEAQMSNRTAFIIQGHSSMEDSISTNSSWKCWNNTAYTPLRGIGYNTYYVSGPGEIINMQAMPKGWKENNFNDSGWANAGYIGRANPKGVGDIARWMLVPSSIPQMELTQQRFAAIRKLNGIELPSKFLQSPSPVTVPANTTATLLLDQSFLTNGYPVLKFSKGNGAAISLIYAESLFNEIPNGRGKSFHKGNRDEIDGKIIEGRRDSIISDGSEGQEFTTLNYRTFRYIQVRIVTKEEPLVLNDIYNDFTGYPFQNRSSFEADDNHQLKQILDIGWRTARACAMETYMDCPYYEQLQYIGDTRIQALVSIYNSGDDRLVRNALDQMDHSRIAEGITLSRHPSYSPQQIPTFSLWYIGMLHDYWMYRGDSSFIRDKLQGVRNVLWFYSKYEGTDGSLKNVPYWNFTDWVNGRKGWNGGTGPIGSDGRSSLLDLQLLWAYQVAASLESDLGTTANAMIYKQKASRLMQSIRRSYWNADRKLFADTPEKDVYSQHANTLAILTGMLSGNEAKGMAEKLLSDSTLAPASIYFKYYLHRALIKAGLGNDYLKWLDKWRENIAMGLTTWAEISEIDQARSDCHAWGSSPNIEFFRTVLGIDADAPGFKQIKIEPHLGALKNVKGEMPHPNGSIKVSFERVNNHLKARIELPKGINGRFIWNGKTYKLSSGVNVQDI
jgi:alpha-L-rhamnosidase